MCYLVEHFLCTCFPGLISWVGGQRVQRGPQNLCYRAGNRLGVGEFYSDEQKERCGSTINLLVARQKLPFVQQGMASGRGDWEKAKIRQEEEEVEEEDLCDQQEKGTGGKKGRHGCPAAELKMIQKNQIRGNERKENSRLSTRFCDRHILWISKGFLLELQIRKKKKKNASQGESLQREWYAQETRQVQRSLQLVLSCRVRDETGELSLEVRRECCVFFSCLCWKLFPWPTKLMCFQ